MSQITQVVSKQDFISHLRNPIAFPCAAGTVVGDIELPDEDIACNALVGWTFKGKLDLSRCRFQRGLLFENNTFEGSTSGLKLRGARINGALRLKNCKNSLCEFDELDITTKDAVSPNRFGSTNAFFGIDLREVKIEDGLEISEIVFPSIGNWVLALNDAQVGGPSFLELMSVGPEGNGVRYVFSQNAEFRAELRVEMGNSSWLWLRNSELEKDVFITVHQIGLAGGGKIVVSDSQIGGDMKISSPRSSGGGLSKGGKKLRSLGMLDLRSVKVRGDVRIKGGAKDGAAAGDPLHVSTVLGQSAEVQGTVEIDRLAMEESFRSSQFICLDSAKAGSGLSLSSILYSLREKREARFAPNCSSNCKAECAKACGSGFAEGRKADCDKGCAQKCADNCGADPTIVSCQDCEVQGTLRTSEISADEAESLRPLRGLIVDLYGSIARNVEIGAVVEAEATIDLGAVSVSKLIYLEKCTASALSLRFASATVLQLDNCTFSSYLEPKPIPEVVDGTALTVSGYVNIHNCSFGKLDLKDSRIGGHIKLTATGFSVFSLCRARVTGKIDLDGDGKERLRMAFETRPYDALFIDEKPYERHEFNTDDRLAGFFRLQEKKLITCGNRLHFDYLEAQEIDLRGCYILPTGFREQKVSVAFGAMLSDNDNAPPITAVGIKVLGDVFLRAEQFPGIDFNFAGTKCKSLPPLADFSNAQIGNLSLANPLPNPLVLTGAIVNRWGFDHPYADPYIQTLRCMDPPDLSHYIRIEEMFENAGKRAAADEMYRHRKAISNRGGKSERCVILSWLEAMTDWLHRESIGYGTKPWTMIGTILYLFMLSWFLFYIHHDDWLQPDTMVQSALVQCGASCGDRRIPQPSDDITQGSRALNAMIFSGRLNMPLVDLSLNSQVEANPDTLAPYVATIFRMLGWATWTVLLASIVPNLIPKRYKA